MDPTASPHPLLTAHLNEVNTLLRGLASTERSQVMDGIRTRSVEAVAAFGDHPTDDQVQTAIGRLGSPRSIADEVYAARDEVSSPRQAIAVGNGDALAERWVPFVVAGLGVVGLVAIGTLAVTLAAVTTGAWVLFTWAGMLLLVSMSPLWTRREKVLLIALLPVGWAFVAVPGQFGSGSLAIPGAVAALLLFALLLPRLVLRGHSRV